VGASLHQGTSGAVDRLPDTAASPVARPPWSRLKSRRIRGRVPLQRVAASNCEMNASALVAEVFAGICAGISPISALCHALRIETVPEAPGNDDLGASSAALMRCLPLHTLTAAQREAAEAMAGWWPLIHTIARQRHSAQQRYGDQLGMLASLPLPLALGEAGQSPLWRNAAWRQTQGADGHTTRPPRPAAEAAFETGQPQLDSGAIRVVTGARPYWNDQALEALPVTAAERRILAEIGRGIELAAIAEQLGISLHTVRAHVRSSMRKLACHRRIDLVQLVQFCHSTP